MADHSDRPMKRRNPDGTYTVWLTPEEEARGDAEGSRRLREWSGIFEDFTGGFSLEGNRTAAKAELATAKLLGGEVRFGVAGPDRGVDVSTPDAFTHQVKCRPRASGKDLIVPSAHKGRIMADFLHLVWEIGPREFLYVGWIHRDRWAAEKEEVVLKFPTLVVPWWKLRKFDEYNEEAKERAWQ